KKPPCPLDDIALGSQPSTKQLLAYSPWSVLLSQLGQQGGALFGGRGLSHRAEVCKAHSLRGGQHLVERVRLVRDQTPDLVHGHNFGSRWGWGRGRYGS